MYSTQMPTGLRLSIVIPTADRLDTLRFTIRTVMDQRYKNLQIIVSDNCSTDGTGEFVESLSDSRIVYVNTSKRVSMSSNWEYAMSFVDGDFVFFLGDDDGLLENSCEIAANILEKYKVKALAWRKPDYTWPGASFVPNMLKLSISRDMYFFNGYIMLCALSLGITSYGALPNVYTAFVSVSLINQIKATTGKFFNSVTPDVYSGIVIGAACNDYIYSFFPFSINGGSAKSNGLSIHRKDDLHKIFFRESDIPLDPDIPAIPGSLSSAVADSFLVAQKLGLTNGVYLLNSRFYWKIFFELRNCANNALVGPGLVLLSELKCSNKLKKKISRLLSEYNAIIKTKHLSSPKISDYQYDKSCSNIVLNADDFGIENVYDCSQFVSKLTSVGEQALLAPRSFMLFLLHHLMRRVLP